MLYKKMLIVLVFLIAASHAYAMPFSSTLSLYNRILIANGIHGAPILIYNPSLEVNASETQRTIEVNQGMLKFVKNADEMALVLGHELGHWLNGDRSSVPAAEYRADKWGSVLMQKTRYDICIGREIILRLSDKGSNTHPPSTDRYKRLSQGC